MRVRTMSIRQNQWASTAPWPETKIASVGTATPPASYTQKELVDLFAIDDPKVRSLFLKSSIQRRHLILPGITSNGALKAETQGELLSKHRKWTVDVGTEAIQRCLDKMGATPSQISFLCCVTTTGFMTPGVSALICQELALAPECARLDVVGMGCNAGLNSLNATSSWATANPGKLAIMLCVEICSAGYVIDHTMRTAVVNCLFGDGGAALAVVADGADQGPAILKFRSHIITDAIDAMRYDWSDEHHKFNFFLDPQIPYTIGANVAGIIDGLLCQTGVRRSDIKHWLIHSGGKKVIDAIRVNLGLSAFDVRHTIGVLRDYGNLSSASFLFSYQRLLDEENISTGDYGVMITMGPGSTIESALLQWRRGE
jgi:3,5-dihydroxyphenylacetyl-CoA synthase